jgi:uncharacterized membrane protein YeaQ/YmgE (transglycosylase-associated protein family)
MAVLMGVVMGFLAFLVIGGISGASSWIFYPGKTCKPKFSGILTATFLGFLAAIACSYLGQYLGLFQSGQMLEWFSAIFAACLVGCLFTASVNALTK